MLNFLFKKLHRPLLSIVVIVYRMPDQARNTLFSLSSNYQQDVSWDDYEVVVVENASDRPLGRHAAEKMGSNFRYFYRKESSVSPVAAINFGVSRARGQMVGIMIDGARMLTPGVVRSVLAANRISKKAVVVVPGYHIGNQLQQHANVEGYDEKQEATLLQSIAWPADGYRLFDIACLSATCGKGYFKPILESNCLCFPKMLFSRIGGCDPRFDLPGGGFVNLDLYKRVCEQPDVVPFMLIGEGTFHQFHEGVTTSRSKTADREDLIDTLRNQYISIRGEKYTPPSIDPFYFGKLNASALKFVKHSSHTVCSESIG